MSSENYTSDQVLEDSGGVDNGNEGLDGKEHEAGPVEPSSESTVVPDLGFSSGEGVSGFVENSDSVGSDVYLAQSPEFELKPIVQPLLSTEEDSNGFVNAESSVETLQIPVVADGETETVSRDDDAVVHVSSYDVNPVAEIEQITAVDMRTTVDQESRSLAVNYADHDNGILVNTDDLVRHEPSDGILTEDAGKEDMFVDAPDQLTVYDGRNADIGESMEIIETREYPEKKLDIQEPQLQVFNNGTQVHHMMDELAHLQAILGKTVNEKEIMEHEYKEEREMFTRELANLHNQLEVLTNQQSLPYDNNNGLVDRLHRTEIGDVEDRTQASDTPLKEMISECSKFVLHLKGTLDEQLQTEGTMRELHAVLYMKDQEIEDLHAKVTELSVSRDVSDSYLGSVQKIWSQSLRESSEVRLEKDLHIEAVTNRMLASLATVIRQDELLGDSVAERISHVEKGTSLLIENYNQFLSEIYKLRQCLTEVCSDFRMPEEKEFGTIFGIACDEMLDRKRKEVEFVEKLNQLEDENRKLLEQLDKEKKMVVTVNAEVGKTKLELEQEKMKSATTKEKLSLAVTKGKALIQQRDSLKLSLAEKASELEKCLIELQEKSNALETVEVSTEELVKSQNLAASLQESLSQREMFIKEIEEVLYQIGTPEELQSMDITERVRWVVDQKNVFETVSLEFRKLKDVLSLIDLPETISSSDLESQVNWLGESFSQAKDDKIRLQDEISSTQAAVAVHELELVEARNEIDRLTASLLAEKQEKDSLQMGLEDLTCKYEGVVEKEYRVSSERDQMTRMFIEASGIKMDDQGDNQLSSNMAMLIEKCIEKIREQNRASFESSRVEAELFEMIKSLLYIRDQELMLCKTILEEEMLERSELINLSNELRISCEQVLELKAERDLMQKNLERAEEKSALLREKLSLAVKKGKGLVQDREGLKHSLDERKTEIEKLNIKLQQQESALSDCRDQIIRLSTDVGHIPKLESDLLVMNDQRDQLEKFLVESNNMLQKVFESIEGIVLPVDAVFEQPVEKVKWLAEYFNEYQVSKTRAEQQLEKVEEEASSLASKLAEAYTTMKSLEDALSEAEKNVSLLAEEKGDIQVRKSNVEKELEKAKEEVLSQASKFAEACATMKSLEDLLVAAEKNMSVLVNEKKDAQVGRTSAEIDLEKAKEEVGSQASKLAEAYITIKSLEDALSQAEKNMALLAEEKNDAQVGRTSLEKELEKVKEGAGSQTSKLADAYMTIKSLEDAFFQAENNISVLVNEKKIFEQEIVSLNAKLAACMEELAGTHGSLESRSVELSGHLNQLQMLMKDEALLTLMKQGFKKKIESLSDMNLLLKNIRDQFTGKGSEGLQIGPGTENDPCLEKVLSADLDGIPNDAMDSSEMSIADINNIPSYLANTVEGFHMKNKLLEDKFESFSSSVDEFIAALLRALQATRDEVIVMCEHMECLEEKVKNAEVYKQAQENMLSTLENDIATLHSACTYATQELQFEVVNNLLDLSFDPELEKFNHSLYSEARESGGDAVVEDQRETLDGTKYVKAAENLLLAARRVRTQTEQFENIRNVSMTFIKDLQNKLNDTRLISENAIEERDLTRNIVSKLESDLETLQNLCSEMGLKLEDCQAKEDILKDREAELLSLNSTLAMKKQEADVLLLSEVQVKTLFDRINGIEIPFFEMEVENPEPHSSALVKKLFCIIDNVATLQHQMNLLSHDKDELQLCLAAQIREIDHLKKEANNQDSEKMKNEFAELALGLEKIIQKLGGNDLVEDRKSAGVRGLLPVLEKQVMAVIGESENSKSKVQELGAKFLGSQKVVDELSTKVKLLEDLIHSRPALPEIVQERSIFEAPPLATGSEISEIEDVVIIVLYALLSFPLLGCNVYHQVVLTAEGPVGKKSMAPVPPAAHVRTMRKGSSDHLALSIDSESDRLINHEETDEDKGHVFKSLNTSGLIPKQGKMVADRIDGIWVSGGRVLMSRPRARLGLIAYWLFLHIWLLGTIL
ncbi:hypothetical protein HHK36_007513 [Tetracentron sinense]|uniref:Uncharacterized protein n=1 Tax=Tetracentron sinense TaxID=13715 RepID=A0A835DPX7_TETSI|nr:hypothetical protein HHK36_007513 [Tetracentron sinense]